MVRKCAYALVALLSLLALYGTATCEVKAWPDGATAFWDTGEVSEFHVTVGRRPSGSPYVVVGLWVDHDGGEYRSWSSD